MMGQQTINMPWEIAVRWLAVRRAVKRLQNWFQAYTYGKYVVKEFPDAPPNVVNGEIGSEREDVSPYPHIEVEGVGIFRVKASELKLMNEDSGVTESVASERVIRDGEHRIVVFLM